MMGSETFRDEVFITDRPTKRGTAEAWLRGLAERIRRTEKAIPIAASVIALMLLAGVGGPIRNTRPLLNASWLMPRSAQASSQSQPARLSAAEFSRLIREFSEDGGYFLSDNFSSNETAYLHVISKMRQLGATGGAYIGVGPEQNFTYIAKVRPRIAFIVDIRRQAMIQHLMFKAIFHLSPTRAQFLSLLICRPIPKEKLGAPDAAITDIVSLMNQPPAGDTAYKATLAAISKTIRDDFQFPLSDGDQASLDYVYKNFRADGLDIAFKMDGFQDGWFPTLRELILEPDQFGKLGNFLAATDDYDFVRDLHERNMIIPVVGDFAGRKALPSVAGYLRKNGLAVSAFYTSNVEQYLFQGGVFGAFAENVRKLPINEGSLFIRAVLNQRFYHPARQGSHMLTTLLQQVSVFLKDYDAGLYKDYGDMVTTHYIAGENPVR